MHEALIAIRDAVAGTQFDGDLWLVGGAVRDELLSVPHKADFDLVTRGSSAELAHFLHEGGLSTITPVTYERFGTAMVHVHDINVEIVTARRESYSDESRKPTVEPATLEEDAARRDFTVNTLMRNLRSGELLDPLGRGLDDLRDRVLRTPLDPIATFYDDPLRMLRAVRFRRKLDFEPAEGLYDAIRESKERLRIISYERIRDELVKMLENPSAPDALQDLMQLGLIEIFAPELVPMVDCEQGKYHHLDVWNHTLLVLRNAQSTDYILSLGCLLHDVGKPPTRSIDVDGNTRFFSHEAVGAEITKTLLRRLKLSEVDVSRVAKLVKNHMRLGTSPVFTPSAARRVLRDMGDQTEELLQLVEADCNALKVGVKAMDLSKIRETLDYVSKATPVETLGSPLTGEEIMRIKRIPAGSEVGRFKTILTEMVLDGKLAPGDKVAAERALRKVS